MVYQGAECCGALMADMPLQHCVEGRDRLPFSKSGTASAVQGITLLTLPGNIYGRVLSAIQTDLVGTMQF